MVREGSCLCGKIRISFEGEPINKMLCHCLDCRKISGSAFSTNIVVPAAGFKILSGTPKTYVTDGDSGQEITSYFCGDCGSTLWRNGKVTDFNPIVKAGVIDDSNFFVDNEAKPRVELFSHRRPRWVKEIPGAVQM
ncbi:Mss4-like protein [Daldinia vernicosa]|uniref:Mss4-like protein n=1 Tax=Daldinia vernicosa TaxID=114800 RepID=UPI002007E6DE|nr:Mss4-like protein [Daldinia vernicosa]KAI0846102.1 Mss4-like protein [Daldinia vernicosa]